MIPKLEGLQFLSERNKSVHVIPSSTPDEIDRLLSPSLAYGSLTLWCTYLFTIRPHYP